MTFGQWLVLAGKFILALIALVIVYKLGIALITEL